MMGIAVTGGNEIGLLVYVAPVASIVFLVAQVVLLYATYVRNEEALKRGIQLLDERHVRTTSVAEEAKKIALDAHDKIEISNAATALHRERLARDMLTIDHLRELRGDLGDRIDRLAQRLDRFLERHGFHPP